MSPLFGDDDDGRLEVDDDGRTRCRFCHEQLHEHDREKVFPDDGPNGSHHYVYRCVDGSEDFYEPGGDGVDS